ncbi:hypothetical protein PSA7680_00023 [Pseudoruegeria aquimaris]|uniref:DUF1206 domain-containing protein n=1 Tax=Pseudoruegeria aquimaris TaxID=393663 RepID=A0A1Y5R6J7_9RHOB|nr:hypothetical protein [Pseudoruegeria aquimaris]SLN10357.1 hypothetical protein PSA7680_00023 [Pseudoruegeria aquimaris]
MKPGDHAPKVQLGHPSRLRDEHGLRVTVFVLGFFILFVLMLTHDEIAQDMVARGMIDASQTEAAELAIGAVLFLFWGALTVGVLRFMRRLHRGPGKGARG